MQIARPAQEVWELVGDPGRVEEWFPGIISSSVTGDERVITDAAGHEISETIVTLNPLQRRFQHEMRLPMFRSHLGTLDVIEIDDQHCMVVYGTDAEPATIALAVAGAVGAALDNLDDLLTGGV
ncbi:MAG: SRPBCC family protein [Acidimicrobiales bacterium]